MDKKKVIIAISISIITLLLFIIIVFIVLNTGVNRLKKDYLASIKKEYSYEMLDVSTDEECYIGIIDLVRWYNECINDIDYYTYFSPFNSKGDGIKDYVIEKYGEYSRKVCDEIYDYVTPYAEKTKENLAVYTEKFFIEYTSMISDVDYEKAERYAKKYGPVSWESFSKMDMHNYVDIGCITENELNSDSMNHWFMKNSIDNNFALRAAYYGNYNQCIQTLVDFLYFAPNNIDTTYDYKRTIASRKLDFASQMIDSIDGWDIVAADGRTLEEIYNDALRDAHNKFYEKKKEEEENKPQESTGSSGNGGYYYWHYGIGDDIYDANLYDDGDDFADDWEDEFDDWDDAYEYWEENH